MILSSSVSNIDYIPKCIKCGRNINEDKFPIFFIGKYENAKSICKKCLKKVKNNEQSNNSLL